MHLWARTYLGLEGQETSTKPDSVLRAERSRMVQWRRTPLALAVILITIIIVKGFVNSLSRSDDTRVQRLQFWPMNYAYIGDSYVVTLRYQVDARLNDKMVTVPEYLVRKHIDCDRALSFEDLVQIPDDQWRLPVNPLAYRVYPQAIDVSHTVDRLLSNLPIPEAPENNHVFRYRTVSRLVCNPNEPSTQNYDVVVIVKTSVGNSQRRQRIRQRLAEDSSNLVGLRFGLVFTLGLPSNRTNGSIEHNGLTFRIPEGNLFSAERMRLLEEEVATFGDMVVGDFEDNYFNLTLKMQFTFTWVATFCSVRRPTVLIIDDDVPFSAAYLAKALFLLGEGGRDDLLHGIPVNYGEVYRDDPRRRQWCLSKEEMPMPMYPTYTLGVYNLMSFANLQRLTLGMLFTRPHHIDDAFIGLVVERLGLRFRRVYSVISRRRILNYSRTQYGLDSQWHL